MAGLKTETNVIGYVAAFNIPEVVRGINAFTLGVRSVNPDAVVKVKWTNTWYDPTKEKMQPLPYLMKAPILLLNIRILLARRLPLKKGELSP